jgi:hypothetical protein
MGNLNSKKFITVIVGITAILSLAFANLTVGADAQRDIMILVIGYAGINLIQKQQDGQG